MSDPQSRAEILAWRKAERRRLIEERLAIPAEERGRHAGRIARNLAGVVGDLHGRIVSAYWPFRGEPDLRRWMGEVSESGGRCALPVVVAKGAPLVFRLWQPGARLTPGVWNIPVPADGAEVVPEVAIAPLVGFDPGCYRLGYGGGFFDRTLAALSPRLLVIGVGYAQAAIATIHPLPHDIPMDAIVTEREALPRCTEREARPRHSGSAAAVDPPAQAPITRQHHDQAIGELSSPACSMQEAGDLYMGYAGRDELTDFLNELLEAERAGARVTLESAQAAGSGPVAELLMRIQRDEARWCAMLLRSVGALDGVPSVRTGAFHGKAMAIDDLGARIAFLNRGQGWVVRKLRAMLPRVRDDRLHADLSAMLRAHETNIAAANDFTETGADSKPG